jgi:hypothetical protein
MDEEIHIGEGESAAEALLGQSILERAVARRTKRDLDHEWFDIPSWDGELKAQYKVLEREDVEQMVRSIRARQVSNGRGNQAGQKSSGSDADLDFIVKACVNIKAHDNETEEEKILHITYSSVDTIKELFAPDPRDESDEATNLRRMVGSIKTPREAVAFLMGYNGIAIAAHGGMLARWMQDTSKTVDPQ